MLPSLLSTRTGQGQALIPSTPPIHPIGVHFPPSAGIAGSLAMLYVGIYSINVHLHLSYAIRPAVESLVDNLK